MQRTLLSSGASLTVNCFFVAFLQVWAVSRTVGKSQASDQYIDMNRPRARKKCLRTRLFPRRGFKARASNFDEVLVAFVKKTDEHPLCSEP